VNAVGHADIEAGCRYASELGDVAADEVGFDGGPPAIGIDDQRLELRRAIERLLVGVADEVLDLRSALSRQGRADHIERHIVGEEVGEGTTCRQRLKVGVHSGTP
jgi:hypothetical protein